MEREYRFIEALNLQAKSNAAPSGELAKRELAEARLVPRAAARLWANAEPPLADEAFDFLVDVEDLAIVPVVEGPQRDDAATVAAAIELVTDQELKLRQRVFERLTQWLEDKRPIPQRRRSAVIEEKAPERRVCDDAYLALRRLVHFGEDELAQLVDARQFLQLPDAKRDEIIARAKATKTWRRIVDPNSDSDAPPSSHSGTKRRE